MGRRWSIIGLGVLLALGLWAYVAWDASTRGYESAGDEAADERTAGPQLAANARRKPDDDAPTAQTFEDTPVTVTHDTGERFGIVFTATRKKQRHPVEEMFSSVLELDPPPQEGYPVRVYWHAPEPIGGQVLEGVTGEDGTCRLAPVTFPKVPYHLSGAVRLAVEGGGGAWSEITMFLDPARVVRTAGAAEGDPPTRWFPIGWSDWKGAPVSGRVVDTNGEPVRGLRVGESRFGSTGTTDADGRFSMRCPTGEVTLMGDASESYFYFHGRPAEDVAFPPATLGTIFVPEDGVENLRLELPERTRVRGHVRLADGAPAFQTNVSLRAPDGRTTRTTTDDQGRFHFIGLKPALRYDVLIDALAEAKAMVSAGDEDVEIVLDRHVLHVVLIDAASEREVPGEVRIFDGNRTPGTKLQVVGWARGYGVVERPYVMKKEPLLQTLRLTLPRTAPDGLVRVRCIGADGAPVARPPLEVIVPKTDFVLQPRWHAEDGWYVTRDLGPGNVTIRTGGSDPYEQIVLGAPGTGNARFVLHTAKTVTLPTSGGLDVELRPDTGGAIGFRISTRGRRSYLRTYPELTNEAGEKVDYQNYRYSGGRWFPHNHFHGASETSAVPAGVYRLQLTFEGEQVDRVIRIDKGRVTPVELDLDAD